MAESTKALAIAAGLAGVAGAAALTVAPNQVSASTGTVTYADGATTVWQTPAFKSVQRYVVKDQSLAIHGQKTINGTTWYQIGAGEWIPEIYLQVQGAVKEATSTANVATAKPTATTAGNFEIHATYGQGAVTVWNGTSYTSASGQYLTTDSGATAVATVQANGETWYKLSNGGFVPARYAAKGPQTAATVAAAAATKTAATATVATPAKAQAPAAVTTTTTTKTTAEDTAATAANAAATTAATPAATPAQPAAPAVKAATPAQPAAPVAKAETPAQPAAPAAKAATPAQPAAPAVKAATPAQPAAPAAKAATPAQPAAPVQSTATPKPTATTATPSQTLTVTYTDSVVTEWQSAGYAQTAGKYLTAGTTVTAVGTTEVNGETWYELSDGNFVSGRYFGDEGKANSNKAKTPAPAPVETPKAATPAPAPAPTPAPQASTQNQQAQQTQTQQPAAPVQNTAASANGSRAARIQAAISVAKAQLGKPYVWGGKGPSSFDCSGLTHYAFLNGAGKEIGGWTGAQEYAGTTVSISDLQVGDLIFWGGHGATYHVAIYLGGNQYIAAPQPGENVKISSISSYFAPSFGVRVL